MFYNSTKSLLRSILQSLETANKIAWDDQIESGNACLYEMHQMSRPLYKAYRADMLSAQSTVDDPISEKGNRAIPYVKSMVRAIRRRDQATVPESGRAALAEM
jgi:hypothetical protein